MFAKRYRILIAYPNQSMLDGMVAVLAPHSELLMADTALNCSELMYNIKEQMPNVCILGIDLPGVDIFQLNQNLELIGINTGIIVIAEGCEPSLKRRIVAAGIKACLGNPFDVSELIRAVSMVANGEDYFAHPFSDNVSYSHISDNFQNT